MTARRHHLASRRKSLGYSQEHLAAELGVDRTTVGRWERGETDPQPYVRAGLCKALKVTPAELDTLISFDRDHEKLLPARRDAFGNTGVVPSPDPMGEPDDMHRRELLRLLSVAAVTVTMPGEASIVRSGVLGAADLTQYAALNAHLWQVYGMSQAKRQVYPLVCQQLAVLTRQMGTSQPRAIHRQLCTLACDLFQLAGEISFDGNRYTDAAHCYALAATAGREAQANDQWACALTRQAFVSMYDNQHGQAADILTAAARVTRHGDSQLCTRHWIAAVHAQAHASLGNSKECDRALDIASNVLNLTGSVSPGGWLRFDGSRLAEERGTCYLATGQNAKAEIALTEALSQANSPRRRASILTDLAILGTRQRDTAQLLHYANAAVDLADQAGSPGYLGRKLHGLQAQLTPMLGDSRIAQLNDRIASLPATT
jgi:transcriptional regulator with XRE-family HTH domain